MKIAQIGSNKGNDDLSRFLKSNYKKLDFGLFVEANPQHIDDLKKCYSNYENIIVENVAIKSPFQDQEEMEIFYNTYDINGEIASCKLSHVLTHTEWCPSIKDGEIKSFKVKCLTLNDLFNNYNITYLDHLLLDIEGIDVEILLTFNWEKYKIKKIEFEHLHLHEYSYNIVSMLEGMGYQKVDSLSQNDWAFENKNIKDSSTMKWQTDLVKDIRTFTTFDDEDGGVPHPLGYGHHRDENNNIIYPKEVTHCNRYHLLEQFNKVRDNCKSILEIGIGRNAEESFAYVFFKNKKKDTVYIGLDLDDRSFLRDSENNIHTIQNDSSYYYENLEIFKNIGVQKFDFIFIDGWHSINQVLRDWEYTNLLAEGGIVGFHDTSCHPGPHQFIKALDKNKWDVIENCCPEDWGIGFARKK
jgi:FkbM family methyltransferase